MSQTGSFLSQGGVPHYPIDIIFEIVELAIRMGEAYKADTLELAQSCISIRRPSWRPSDLQRLLRGG